MRKRFTQAELDTGLRALVERWLRDADVAAAYLHGSRGRGNARPGSDVDLAVILAARVPPAERWNKRLVLLDQAATALRSDAVDLLILEDAPPAVAHRALRDGRLILDGDPHRRVAVVETVFRQYIDQAWLRRELDEGLRARLAEGRFAR
ncbi:MAG TPA: nucleotidyltransferase domain-containing protein [Gammaproteobacteria bacterium]|jgi:predicted nucleotidyltransferase|nr:nucleotidyltransferase domain-containing protein [Gammaproteobacteria bacterium]